ncbi:LysE family translocator [Streptomyces sp. NPDC001902]|nr:LysE family translocator [Streptomyces sp. PA03-1a]MDX2814301.1 LysE family translocator [Streptomyces sp. PA03-5A]
MLTFAAASLVLIVIPGPDQALITRNALAAGRAGGLLTMVGGVLGLGVHIASAALGVSALLMASTVAFTVLRTVGAGYLLYMGFTTLRAARRAADSPEPADGDPPPNGAAHLRQGFLSNSLNPKVALFFVTFLPQFLPAQGSVLPRALLLSLVFAVLYVTWFGTYVVVVDRVGAVLRRPVVRARVERVTGVLLIGFALRLAVH